MSSNTPNYGPPAYKPEVLSRIQGLARVLSRGTNPSSLHPIQPDHSHNYTKYTKTA